MLAIMRFDSAVYYTLALHSTVLDLLLKLL